MYTKREQQHQEHNNARGASPLLLTGTRSLRTILHHRKVFLLVLLILSAFIVIMESVWGSRFFSTIHRPGLSGSKITSHTPTTKRQSDTQLLEYQQIATLYASRMTLDEKLGQLFMVGYDAPTYSSDLDRMITEFHVGGVILYQAQIHTLDQAKHDIAEMQKRTKLPLLISTDEEGGYVDRLANIYPPRPSALSIYRTGDPGIAAQMGHQTAHDLLALGINENLAPDSDVQLVDGPDQLTRTFGFTPQSVIAFAGAYMQAMQHDDVIACIKHFPGLGAARTDAHLGLPIVRRTKAELFDVELAPFKAFVQAHNVRERPGMVMSTDILMLAIDPQFPAELSHIFITDILRNQFGYNGVIITDSLSMQGISNNWDMAQASAMALKAGNDMLMGISSADQMARTIAELKSALRNGTLSQNRIDEAVIHILMLKLQYHLLPAGSPVRGEKR